MIVFEPAGRLQNAEMVLQEVESIIRRIEMNAHPINLEAPQPCSYCGVGTYQVAVNPSPEFRNRQQDDIRNFAGLTAIGDPIWLILVCDYCGNVQMFRTDRANDRNIWTKGS